MEPSGTQRTTSGADEESLRGSALIQIDHPKIKERATAIVGEEKDPWKQALALYEWVYRTIRKVSVFSIPSALEVLESGRGRLQRAHGAVYGLGAIGGGYRRAWRSASCGGDELNGFYYHAWPEVFVGGWVSMDPTLGQPLADATHFALLHGDIDRWTQLIPYLGQLKIDVKSIE